MYFSLNTLDILDGVMTNSTIKIFVGEIMCVQHCYLLNDEGEYVTRKSVLTLVCGALPVVRPVL